MCGIAGVIAARGVDDRMLAAMAGSLRHRGPDAAAHLVAGGGTAGLAHARLAIIDLDARANQPMSTADGRFTIVFNGEIYNYIELREELRRAGASFRTESDTEVLLQAFAAWGPAMLDRIVGMFAFAVWDAAAGRLFAARDRLGKKPLVYTRSSGRFAFASEVKALVSTGLVSRRLSTPAMDAYLALGYVPAPFAMFEDVRKLPAGHHLTYDGDSLAIERYWPDRLSTLARKRRIAGDEVDAVRALIGEAVRVRLRSDVPVGLFLSGGLDSSAVACEARRMGATPHALTVRFDHDDTDARYGTLVAEHLGLPHSVIDVEGDVAEEFRQLFWHYDEPISDSSIVPSYAIARAAHSRFKVILNGDGGDEVFGGYSHFVRVAAKQCVKRMAASVGAVDGSPFKPRQVYFQSKALFREPERRALLGPRGSRRTLDELIDTAPVPSLAGASALGQAMANDLHLELPNRMLFKSDIAMSAFGVEGRSPLLDHRLVEWSWGLADPLLVNGARTKVLLRAAYASELPSEITMRAKHGFGSPIGAWLGGPLRGAVADLLPTPLLSSSLQAAVVREFFATSEQRAAARLWSLLSLAAWARVWSATW